MTQEDSPVENSQLAFLSGIKSKGSIIYIADHLREYQGRIRMVYSLKGLGGFQRIWRKIAFSVGLISKRSPVAFGPEMGKSGKENDQLTS